MGGRNGDNRRGGGGGGYRRGLQEETGLGKSAEHTVLYKKERERHQTKGPRKGLRKGCRLGKWAMGEVLEEEM